MKKRKEKTLKEETLEEAITRNPKREKHKNEGGDEPYTSRHPPQPPFFSLVLLDFASSSCTPR